MPRITAISPSPRDPSRLVIRVDGKVVATLRAELARDLKLTVDRDWDDELAARVADAAAYDKAHRDAVSRLNRRAMSRASLRDKLIERGHDESAVRRVLERLEQAGLIDDEALGRELLDQLQTRGPAGPAKMRERLERHHLEPALIDSLLGESTAGRDPVADAVALAQQRLRAMARLDPPARVRRLAGLLARRGFEPDVVEIALRQVLGDEFDHVVGGLD